MGKGKKLVQTLTVDGGFGMVADFLSDQYGFAASGVTDKKNEYSRSYGRNIENMPVPGFNLVLQLNNKFKGVAQFKLESSQDNADINISGALVSSASSDAVVQPVVSALPGYEDRVPPPPPAPAVLVATQIPGPPPGLAPVHAPAA
jgi:hypothetical protein